LAPNQALEVKVLDIDLAGQFEPWNFRLRNIRVMRDITWPRMKVQYTFREDGAELLSAGEDVADLNYLGRPTLCFSNDRLRYEKQMLDDWFYNRFVRRESVPR
jgi:hypothetical protein